MIDPASPFFAGVVAAQPAVGRTIHVLFCAVCHYVWKAPAKSTTCINCIQLRDDGTKADTVVSLTTYETDVSIT